MGVFPLVALLRSVCCMASGTRNSVSSAKEEPPMIAKEEPPMTAPTLTKLQGDLKAPPLDPLLWNRECFTDVSKQLSQLEKVYRATMSQLRNYDRAVLTSFRRGGPNERHQLLNKADAIFKAFSDITYTHYQSGHENTLFGYGPSQAAFATDGKACKTEEETQSYKSLQMREYWYVEWLAVLQHIAKHGGVLAVFDLEGNGAMSSSPNCAMELALLYKFFGEDLEGWSPAIHQNVQIVLITDCDLKKGVDLATRIKEKLKDQAQQLELFIQAYEKCSKVLEDARATKYLGRWIRDSNRILKAVGIKTFKEQYSGGISSADFQHSIFMQMLNDGQLAEYVEDVAAEKEWMESFTELNSDEQENHSAPELPDSIEKLQNLRTINATNTSLTSLPNTIGKLQSLTEIQLFGCKKLTVDKDELNVQLPNCTIYFQPKPLEWDMMMLNGLNMEYM